MKRPPTEAASLGHGSWSKVSVLSSVSPWAIEPCGAPTFGPRYHGSFTWLRLPPLTWSSSSMFSSQMSLFNSIMSFSCELLRGLFLSPWRQGYAGASQPYVLEVTSVPKMTTVADRVTSITQPAKGTGPQNQNRPLRVETGQYRRTAAE